MAAKKDKSGSVEALRADVQALADAFWGFKDSFVTDLALQQAEQQAAPAKAAAEARSWSAPADTDIDDAAAMLSALGHPQRLRIAMALAKSPVTVNELVQQLGLKTTGAAYHHLNVLTNAGIVNQPQRGSFEIVAEAAAPVSAVLASLFGEEEEPDEKSSSGKKSKKKS